MLRTAKQNIIFHSLIGKLKIDKETKAGLVFQFTGERTSSSAEMMFTEMQNLIHALQTPAAGGDAADRMRKKIIALAKHEMSWTMEDIDKFCKERGHVRHDKLNDYTLKELPSLVVQFERVHKSFIKSLTK